MGFLLRENDKEAFVDIYERFWKRVYTAAYHRVNSRDVAYEIAQEIFVSLWARRNEVTLHSSLSAYLNAAVRNQVFKYFERGAVRARYLSEYMAFWQADNSNEETVLLHDLEEAVERGMEGLPKRCQEVFRMSRHENKSVKEIAQQLEISHKTVENYLTSALRHLRVSLGDFFVVLILTGLTYSAS